MNKLISKIVGVGLGLALATGVGAGIVAGNNQVAKPVYAAGPYDDQATMAAGTNGSTAVVSVGGVDYDAIKVGTSKAGGSMTITVPSGATALNLYAAAWKGVTGLSLNITPNTNVNPTSIALTANDGIANNSPFTFSGTLSSPFNFEIALSNISSSTTFTFTSSSSKRFVVWNPTYRTAGGQTVAVSSVTMSSSAATIKVGKTAALSATIAPQNATCSVVSWLSSNTSIATVSNGTVTGVAAGSATITAFADENNNGTLDTSEKRDTCEVTVQAIQTINSSVADAITAANALPSGDTSADLYCVTGYVTSVEEAWSSYNNVSFHIADAKSGSTSITCYRIHADQTVGQKVLVNAKISVTGNLKNHNGNTPEVINNSGVATPITILEESSTVFPEPTMKETTLAGFIGATSDAEKAELYHFAAKVKAVTNTTYGNMTLTDDTNDLTVYGSTATTSALVWGTGTGVYNFTNPQDFANNSLTSGIAAGDMVEVKFIRYLHNNAVQGQGIIVDVIHTPTVTVSPASLTLTAGGETSTLAATTTNAGSATVAWSTSDNTVATVVNGVVTPIAQGTCDITASITVDNQTYSSSCAVTVNAAPIVINADGVYTVVEDASTLAAGDIVIITRSNGETAMSTTQNGNNRGATVTNISDGKISISGTTDIQAFSLEQHTVNNQTAYAFYTGEGYIYAAGSDKNYLRTETTLDNNGKFTVSIASGVATITAQGTNSRNLIQYNTSNSIFSCYGGTQTQGDVSIFRKGNEQVDPTKVANVTLSQNSAIVNAEDTVTLTATIAPNTATTQTITWLTSDNTVATVSNGVVTGVAAGSATITAFADENNNGVLDSDEKSATCTVTVKAVSAGFFYQVTDASSLAANDKILIATHDGDNVVVMNNYDNGSKKFGSFNVSSNSKWSDTFGSNTVKTIRVDKTNTAWTLSGSSSAWTLSNGTNSLYAKVDGTDFNESSTATNFTFTAGTYGTFRMIAEGSNRAISYRNDTNVYGNYATSNIDGATYFDVEIYKLIENPTVLTLAGCNASGSFSGDWNALKTSFNALSLGEKAYYKHASFTVTNGTTVTPTNNTVQGVAEYMAKYDYIIGKYNTTSTTTYEDFIQRVSEGSVTLSSISNQMYAFNINSDGVAMIVVITAVLSFTALGGYFFLRKKKEN